MRPQGAALIGVTLTAVAISVAAAAPAPQRVKGTAVRVIHPQSPCRGGAAVQREELAELEERTQRLPLGKVAFTVFAGRKHVGRPVTRFKTDGSARFEIVLPEGVYCIMAGDLKDAAPETAAAIRSPDPHVDQGCLRDLALACDATLHVRRDNTRPVKLTLETFPRCPQPWAQPCWRGPMPP